MHWNAPSEKDAGAASRRGSRVDECAAGHADNVLYLAREARLDYLLTLPEAAEIGFKSNAAMREVEKHKNPAFGSGGMFVQSGRFVAKHHKIPSAE